MMGMLCDWLEKVGLDVYDDPSPPPPVQPEKTPELTFNLPSKSLDTLFSAHLLGNETPEPKGVKEFLATPEYEHEESQPRVEEVSTAADYQSRSSMVVKEVGVLKTLSSSPDTDTAVEASQELPEVQEDSDQQSRTNEFKGRSKSAASTNLSTWCCSTIRSETGLSEFEDLM
ncbi:hypothetical protein AOLI_G00180340 [Acnodon oligacanthus]